jgi:acetylornithine/succinyldiaminopimelate/putrescine aminotransferase
MFRLCVFSLRNRFCVYRSIGLQALEKKYGCQNYAPLPITIQVGKGIYLWDVDGI